MTDQDKIIFIVLKNDDEIIGKLKYRNTEHLVIEDPFMVSYEMSDDGMMAMLQKYCRFVMDRTINLESSEIKHVFDKPYDNVKSHYRRTLEFTKNQELQSEEPDHNDDDEVDDNNGYANTENNKVFAPYNNTKH